MAYPYGVKYSTLTFSQPLAVSGVEADRTSITITPTQMVTWADSGRPIEAFTDTVAAAKGQPGKVTAPFVDQAGFRDNAGQAVTGWAYKVTRTAWYGAQQRQVVKLWAPLVGQTVVDFDMLADTDPADPYTVVAPVVSSVAGATGAVGIDFLAERLTPWMDAKVAEGTDPAEILPTVEAAVRDPNSGLHDAVNVRAQAAADARFTARRGAVNGVASLDGDGLVPLTQVPVAAVADSAEVRAKVNARIDARRASPDGVASLDANALIPIGQVPVQSIADSSPISTTVNTRIDAKRGAANGIAALDGDGRVPVTQIPVSAVADEVSARPAPSTGTRNISSLFPTADLTVSGSGITLTRTGIWVALTINTVKFPGTSLLIEGVIPSGFRPASTVYGSVVRGTGPSVAELQILSSGRVRIRDFVAGEELKATLYWMTPAAFPAPPYPGI